MLPLKKMHMLCVSMLKLVQQHHALHAMSQDDIQVTQVIDISLLMHSKQSVLVSLYAVYNVSSFPMMTKAWQSSYLLLLVIVCHYVQTNMYPMFDMHKSSMLWADD